LMNETSNPEAADISRAAQTDPVKDYRLSREELQDRWLEILVTIMLGLATVATAWSGYQAALWGGVQSTLYSQASTKRMESVRDSNAANTITNLDIWLFGQWVEYKATGKADLADFYEQRFREEFKPAFEAWLATDPFTNPEAPPSPFAMPEYRLSLEEEAQALELEAENTFAQGQQANRNSDHYVLNTVILASVLFLTSLQSRLEWRIGRILIIILALGLLFLGVYNLITYPLAMS
jgi:hypothetical protein